jgi:hypothetical protein
MTSSDRIRIFGTRKQGEDEVLNETYLDKLL